MADDLPGRFYNPQPAVKDGDLVGLRDYIRDLTTYLDEHLAPTRRDDPSVTDVMAEIGIPPSEWYRHALGRKQHENG
ncbi:MAG: hypothetical protein ACRC20_10145 [Segniliparus sp.]